MYRNIHYISRFGRQSALLAMVTSLLLAGCGRSEAPQAVSVTRPVKMIELEAGGLSREIDLPGQILPLRQANMAFEVSGVMIELLVEESQEVEKGQLLARLDPRDYAAARDAARAQMNNAQIEAERATALFERDATSKQRVDIAESNLTVAEAAFDRAEKAYQDTYMRAPIAGVVSRIGVDDFVNVQAKQEVMIIQDLTGLRVVVDIPETLSGTSQPNLTLEERTVVLKPTVYLSFLPERGFPGRLSEFSTMADPATRTFQGTMVFDPPEDVIVLPGMTARVRVTLPDPLSEFGEAFAVPVNAVLSDSDGQSSVWVVNDDTMTVRLENVETGHLSDERIEIISDTLKSGDRVVTSGVQLLQDGDSVKEF